MPTAAPQPAPAPPLRRRGPWVLSAALGLLASAALLGWPHVTSWAPAQRTQAAQQLAPTPHPPVPTTVEASWLVPADAERQGIAQRPAVRALRAAAAAIRANRYADAALALESASLEGTPLEPYVEYYRALSDLRRRRPAPARQRLVALRASLSAGRLRQLTLSAEAEAALSLGDAAGAATLLEESYPGLISNRDVVLDQWATALRASGRVQDAARIWLRLYYEFPASELASSALRQAETALGTAAVGTAEALPRDLTRAEALLTVGRAADAAAALQHLLPLASAHQRDRVRLGLAEAACLQDRCTSAIDDLTDLAARDVGSGEAAFLLAGAYRGSGRIADSRQQVERLASRPAGSAADPWAERALNDLGTHLIKTSADAEAADVFRQLFDRNPSGRHGERAAWKYGWWSYRLQRYDEAVRVFESAASHFPRANTRPAWLYWAGRAREQLHDLPTARQRLTLTAVDYLHSYYGRLASDALTRLGAPVPTSASGLAPDVVIASFDDGEASPDATDQGLTGVDDTPVSLATDSAPPTADLIAWLVSAGMFDEATLEMQHSRRANGRHPRLDATLAWVYRQQGEIRPAINTMRQAYPQYLSAKGDALPRPIQEVIFPIDYVPLIKRYAALHDVDPFVVAALIGQESSYVADVRSPADAWGLMQILPSTGSRLARAEGLTRFRTPMLTNPETNVRLGTRYFASLVRQLGGVPYALAGYNAGENRVVRWKAERQGVEQAEFIDDIPFPETQMYVKKILGTAVDYRRLYGNLLGERGAE